MIATLLLVLTIIARIIALAALLAGHLLGDSTLILLAAILVIFLAILHPLVNSKKQQAPVITTSCEECWDA